MQGGLARLCQPGRRSGQNDGPAGMPADREGDMEWGRGSEIEGAYPAT